MSAARTPKPIPLTHLTPRQEVALAIAAGVHSGLTWEIFNTADGNLSKQISDRSYEFADVFLAAEVK